MSLKAVHLIFVNALAALCFGCAVWLLKTYSTPEGRLQDLLIGILGVIGGIAVLIYGRRFVKKLKKVSYL